MIKNDKIDALILLSGYILIQKNTDFYKNTDTSNTLRPKSLDRRVQRNINKEHRKNEFGPFYNYVKRFAVAILIVCTLSIAVVIAVEPLREAVWNVIVEFFDDYMAVDFAPDDQTPSAEAHPPTMIEEIREIDPGNADLKKQVILSSDSMYCVNYTDDESIVFSFSQNLLDATESWINNENAFTKNVKVGEYTAILIFNVTYEAYMLCWSDGEYSYILDSYSPDISEEELISIAKTVR